jgi:hypothetical protein
MAPPRNRIGDILVKARVIDELQLRSALANQEQWGGRVSRIVAELGLASEDTITQAISQGLGMPRASLGNLTKDPAALSKVDVSLAEQKGIFPIALKDGGKTLMLAMADPTDLTTIDQVVAKTRARVVPMVAGEREIQIAILRHYRNMEPAAASAGHNPFSPTPKRDAGADSGDEDEFKIVDMSGKTVMKRLSDIVDPNAQPPAPAPAPPPPAPAPPPPAPVLPRASAAADMLDEILAGGSAPAGFSPEEMQRLESLQANQEKSSKILRALLELLFEKGALNQRELAGRMKM